jgi:UDP-glucose 4-epimerase
MPIDGSVALVTGAGGFIGANLARRLAAGQAEVHAVVRPETDRWRLSSLGARVVLHELDLTDGAGVARLVDRVRPTLVFHMARQRGAPSALAYRTAYRVNLEATLNLLEAVGATGGCQGFVHAGSSFEYDLSRSPVGEDAAPAPRTVHGVTKAAATLLVQHFARARDIPGVVLRFFTVYGSWDAGSRLVPTLMLAALAGRPVRLTRPGLCHDWIHVEDVVEACIRGATSPGVSGEILNIATGRQSSNEEVAAIVERLSGRPLAMLSDPFPARPWDTERWVADVSKARRLLGWSASYDLAAGLAETLAWFRRHLALYGVQA